MTFVLWEILIPLVIALLLGLLLGWLWWGWRRTKITYTEWETMRQKAGRASSVEAEAELAELRAERDRLQAQIDSHVCEVSAAADADGADLGTGVLGLSGAVENLDDAATDAEVAESPDAADTPTEDSTTDDSTTEESAADDAATTLADADLPVTGERHPYGEGSHAPFADDPKRQPAGYDIKGNADSMLYHRPDSRSYKVTIAEVWFDTAERAEASGFGLAKSHPKD